MDSLTSILKFHYEPRLFQVIFGCGSLCTIGWAVVDFASLPPLQSRKMAKKQQMAVIRDTWQAMQDPDADPLTQRSGPAKKSEFTLLHHVC